MPFYKALQFILTTSSSKIKRRSWEKYYLSRGYFNNSSVILINEVLKDGSIYSSPYTATNTDLTANDWCAVEE